MVPTLPFVLLTIALTVSEIKLKRKKTLVGTIVLTGFIFAFSYFATVRIKPDTRISASLWAKDHIYNSSPVLSEIYDMGIVPFNQYFLNINLFNFYDLDQTPETKSFQLEEAQGKSAYIILPSPINAIWGYKKLY